MLPFLAQFWFIVSCMKLKTKPLLLISACLVLLTSCAPEDPEDQVTPDYSGSYYCKETTSNPAGTTTFTVHLKKQTAADTYTMENFYNVGFNHAANLTISGSAVSLPSQTISGFSASGSGSVQTDGKISLTYRVDDGSGSGSDNCTATLTKQ